VRAEFVVVGAVIIGAAITRHLARSGAATVLLEQGEIAGGATGLSAGMVRAYDQDPLVRRLAAASFGTWPDVHATGAAVIAAPDRAAAFEQAARELRDRWGIDARVGDAAGGIALIEPAAGWVDATAATRRLVAAAVGDGAVVHTHTRVVRTTADHAGPVVHTEHERIRAGAVVLALGAWSTRPPPGLRVPAGVRTRAIQVSLLRRPIHAPAHASFLDLRTGGYARPAGSCSLVGAPLVVWNGNPDRSQPPDPAHHRRTVRLVRANLPWVTGAPLVRMIRALDGYTSGSELILPTALPRVWFARVWNGGGVKVAPAAGQEIAAALLSNRTGDHDARVS
jgi:glycine/D-amino acid oxidase-like deaminating enzyme